jgi:hypothetical protein
MVYCVGAKQDIVRTYPDAMRISKQLLSKRSEKGSVAVEDEDGWHMRSSVDVYPVL